ncbi:putative trans-anethole oxidase protein [Neofusicoccum parvum UCRNP2]|uniref:Putative trans-anethole oxidase protein n=1 Tax=Botryosphaeria parva (strain UCR-NP2) TaxID=1287680 RepID=R1FXL1_BOTPV|nr:putative trans-anethole oxidase protein [Neofusicoccum parvum UCRNP2]
MPAYHWISREIESLDPYTDYEKIYRLSSAYGLNDFANNLIYALTFPNFVVTPHGAEVVWRDDGGKVLSKATQREEETQNNNALWWYYGPSDARTQKSIEGINRLHKYWASKYPGRFNDNEDFIYTLAFSAILMHRLRLRLGLPGFSEKQKIASHLFWREMGRYFRTEDEAPLHGFPADWDATIAYCEAFENAPREGTERGHLIAEAIYAQFAFRYFPRPLQWLGRAMPVALSLPSTLKVHKVEPLNPALAAVIVWFVGWMFWFLENVLPDPAPEKAWWPGMENMTKEESSERKGHLKEIDQRFKPFFASSHASHWPGCPYHAAMGKLEKGA